MNTEPVWRETIITFNNDEPFHAIISTTYPYIAKQLDKDDEAIQLRHSHDPKSNVEDSWEYQVPIGWFFHKGRLRIPRRLNESSSD